MEKSEVKYNFPTVFMREGLAKIIIPHPKEWSSCEYAPSKAPVFFNPAMKLNRDLAVLILQAYQKMVDRELVVSEPLTGCGVRGIRFAKEVDGIREVHINDINPEAYKMAQHNIKLNKVEDKVYLTNEDANLFLSKHDAPYKRFDYIDLDPFGTPVIYLDSAVRALRGGGLLALTATDLAPLCGVYPKTALRKYGGTSLRTEYSYEIAVRLLTGCLASAAAKHDIGIKVVFSYKGAHYIRVYALFSRGVKKASQSIQNLGFIRHCFSCLNRETVSGIHFNLESTCSECGSTLKTAGPLWLGRICDRHFCELVEKVSLQKRVNDEEKIRKVVNTIKSESEAPPTYFVVDYICDKLNIQTPSLSMLTMLLREKGFKTWSTHFHTRGLKTDASAKTILETIKNVV